MGELGFPDRIRKAHGLPTSGCRSPLGGLHRAQGPASGSKTMAMPATSNSASGAHAWPKRQLLAHIPGHEGWPIVGNTFSAIRDPVGHAQAMYRKHGPIYRDHLFGVRSI